jgi:imidazolonepropionase-like amidohydrolase
MTAKYTNRVRRQLLRSMLGAGALAAQPLRAMTAQNIGSQAGSQDGLMAIVGGRIHPVSSAPIARGTVLVRNGKIMAVGAEVRAPARALIIDATGKWVTPGLFNASTGLGLTEINMEAGDSRVHQEIAAASQSWDGMNPASALWQVTVNEGVTSALVRPVGGLISGQGAVVRTQGESRRDLLRRAPAAMVFNVQRPFPPTIATRGELWMVLRGLLQNAVAYGKDRRAYSAAHIGPPEAEDQLEALQLVLGGRIPVIFTANRADDILEVIEFSKQFGLRAVIDQAAEAWKVAKELAASGTAVITTALDSLPADFDSLGARQENAAMLRAAGVDVMLMHFGRPIPWDMEMINVRNIRQQAGNAVAYGMPWEEALRAVTLTPAEVFGVSGSIGSLAIGKDADLVVWSDDPFELRSHAETVLIGGVSAIKPSRQDMLTQRYLERLRSPSMK